jgi:hypothetical protein
VRADKESLREACGIHLDGRENYAKCRYFGVAEELAEGETNQYQIVGLEMVRGSEVDIEKGGEMVRGIHRRGASVVPERGLLIRIHCALEVLEKEREIRSHYA